MESPRKIIQNTVHVFELFLRREFAVFLCERNVVAIVAIASSR